MVEKQCEARSIRSCIVDSKKESRNTCEISGFHCEVDESCAITHGVVVIPYLHFGTTYLSHLLESRIQEYGFLTLEDGTDMLSQNTGKELPLHAASIAQMSVVLNEQHLFVLTVEQSSIVLCRFPSAI